MSASGKETGELQARPANVADVTAITAIYNEGIADRIATFETEPRSEAQVRQWLGRRFPVVVVENGRGDILGFASTSSYRDRSCYAGIAEFSVYVARAHRREGVGRVALHALIRGAEAAGFWKLISRIFVENEASRALCCKIGFREVGTYERHGKLDGEWRDAVIVERLIGEAAAGA
jgi:phosphinothricin acetyltransferase